MHRSHSHLKGKQRGAVLFVAMILLLILSLFAVSSARLQTVEERMARNEDNRQVGSQAAEAALRFAESGILNGTFTNFGSATGLYQLVATSGSVVPTINWTDATQVLTYGGPTLTTVPVASAPKFIIENLPAVAMPGDSINQTQYADPVPPVSVYRVTAQAVGADGTTTTTLQSIFR